MSSKNIRVLVCGALWLVVLALLVLQAPSAVQAKPEANRWSVLGSGVNNYVNTIAIKASDVYVGGGFTKSGTKALKYVGVWNTASKVWSDCGYGLNKEPLMMVAKGKKIFVGGGFGGEFKTWHTTKHTWATVGGRVNGPVYTLTFDGNDLYVGGDFDTVGGSVTAHNLAKFNLTTKTWSPLGGGLNAEVWAIAVQDHLVFVGGNFEHEEGNPAALERIAKWDGAQWNAIGGGVDAPVFAIVPYGSELFVGGAFANAYDTNGGAPIFVNHIAHWNGAHWNTMGSGMSAGTDPLYGTYVWTLTLVGDDLYVGGSCTTANSMAANYIAKTNVTTHAWSALGSGTDDIVWSMAYKADEHKLYIGGEFLQAGGKSAKHIATWRVQ